MNAGELIAPYLGLKNGEKPLIDSVRLSSNDVTNFRLKIPSTSKEYTVHLIQEMDESSNSLTEAASAAGVYNSKYFYEMAKFERLDLDVGIYEQALKIDDDGKSYPVFVTERFGESASSYRTLELDQLYQVAEQLGKLHAFCLPEPDLETKKTLDNNHKIIAMCRAEKFAADLKNNLALLTKNFANLFKKPEIIADSVKVLYRSGEDLNYVTSLPSQLQQPPVLCHGELSAEKIAFNEKGKLAEIRNWDNVHFGCVAEDLSYLIISSGSTSTRRDRYMSIFRRYYYILVDLVAPKFKLVDLKECFKKMHKYAVLASFSQLVKCLQSNAEEKEKAEFAERWETALEDAVAIEKDEYPSDNEDVFFSK